MRTNSQGCPLKSTCELAHVCSPSCEHLCVHTQPSLKKREKNEYCACYIQKLEDNEILFKPKILNYDVNIFFIYGKEYILNIKEKLDSKKQYYKFICFC